MLFSTVTFVFLFLPLAIMLYYLQPKVTRNIFLLVISLIFYAWGEPVYVLLMMASISLNFLFGILIDRNQPSSKSWLTVGILVNVLLLVYYKYFWFICQNLNAVFGWSIGDTEPVAMPIGISFYTFQSLSYLIDVYRKEVHSQRNVINLGLYISFFPQLIAGPIIRYIDVNQQIRDRTTSWSLFSAGVQRFVVGFSKKVLIANTLGEVADKVFALPADTLPATIAWLGIVCYTFQIFFDFSGYSDMAIGLGKMFGFEFMENFNFPYIARSIREFWRRWHISLSTWFRDYLYIPLGGSRLGEARTYFNLILVFFITGLWHGASWNFVVWGLFHGFFLILERNSFGTRLQRSWVPLQHVYALLVIMVGWVFFRSGTLAEAASYLKVMAGMGTETEYTRDFYEFVDIKVWTCLAFATLLSIPLETKLSGRSATTAWQLAESVFLVTAFFLSLASVAADAYNPFIYFRF